MVDEVEKIGVVAPSVDSAFGVVVTGVVEDVVETDELTCSDVGGSAVEINAVILIVVDDVDRTTVVLSSVVITFGVVVVGVVEDVVELVCSDIKACVLIMKVFVLVVLDKVGRITVVLSSLVGAPGVIVVKVVVNGVEEINVVPFDARISVD